MDSDNRPLWDGQRRGFGESWYFIVHDLKSRAAFWLRYTFHSPLEGPAFAGLWAFAFVPGAAPIAVRETFPVGEFSADPFAFALRIGAGRLESGLAAGRIDAAPRAAWNLTFKPAAVTYHPAPPLVRAFSRARFTVPNPRVRFQGSISLGGRTWAIENAPGCQGHFAAPSLGDGWTWAHATEFEEGAGFAEAISPGGGPLASVGVAWGGRVWPGNALLALPAGRCEGADWTRTFRADTESGPVEWEVRGDPSQAVGLEYADPAGGRLYAYNTLLASSTLRLGDRTLHSRGTTILEITSDLPRLDVPIALRAPAAPAAAPASH